MNLVKLSVGIAQEKRWTELAVQPPKPRKPVEPSPIIPLIISPEFQKWIDAFTLLLNYKG